MKLQLREKQFFLSTEDPEDIQVARTTDEFIYDNRGKRFIDFNSGWCVGNLGWRRKEIQSKIKPATPVEKNSFLWKEVITATL